MGTVADTLPMIRGLIFSSQHYSTLSSTFTTEEIRSSLISMDAHKSPGIDGYDVHFFKLTWTNLGAHIVHVIQQFSDSGFLPKS